MSAATVGNLSGPSSHRRPALLPLAPSASLADVQKYVAKMETERGLAGQGIESQCLKAAEETGELGAAALDDPTAIPGELIDVLILATSIANRAGIDLTHVIRSRSALEADVTLTTLPDHAATRFTGDLHLLALRAGIQTGEICRAVRKLLGKPADPTGRTVILADACADLFLLIGAIAADRNCDLADAWRTKEEVNNSRTWR